MELSEIVPQHDSDLIITPNAELTLTTDSNSSKVYEALQLLTNELDTKSQVSSPEPLLTTEVMAWASACAYRNGNPLLSPLTDPISLPDSIELPQSYWQRLTSTVTSWGDNLCLDYLIRREEDICMNAVHDQFKSDWVLICTATNAENEYYGLAFLKKSSPKIIISHRGTNITSFWNCGSVSTDVDGVMENRYTNHINSALTFVLYITQAIQNLNYEIELSITGHSLGGWLAQITTFVAKHFQFDSDLSLAFTKEELCHPHCEVFDSPGTKHILEQLNSKFNTNSNTSLDPYSYTDLISYLDITIYFGAPNIINITNEHVGKLVLINFIGLGMVRLVELELLQGSYAQSLGLFRNYVMSYRQMKSVELFNFSYQMHQIDMFIIALYSKNVSSEMYELTNWPRVVYNNWKTHVDFETDPNLFVNVCRGVLHSMKKEAEQQIINWLGNSNLILPMCRMSINLNLFSQIELQFLTRVEVLLYRIKCMNHSVDEVVKEFNFYSDHFKELIDSLESINCVRKTIKLNTENRDRCIFLIKSLSRNTLKGLKVAEELENFFKESMTLPQIFLHFQSKNYVLKLQQLYFNILIPSPEYKLKLQELFLNSRGSTNSKKVTKLCYQIQNSKMSDLIRLELLTSLEQIYPDYIMRICNGRILIVKVEFVYELLHRLPDNVLDYDTIDIDSEIEPDLLIIDGLHSDPGLEEIIKDLTKIKCGKRVFLLVQKQEETDPQSDLVQEVRIDFTLTIDQLKLDDMLSSIAVTFQGNDSILRPILEVQGMSAEACARYFKDHLTTFKNVIDKSKCNKVEVGLGEEAGGYFDLDSTRMDMSSLDFKIMDTSSTSLANPE